MPLEIDKTTKLVDLDLPSDIPQDLADDIKADVGQYLVDAILDNVGSGKSPVAGYGAFAQLSKEYAESEKGGRRIPNLDLNGDMLNSLTYEVTPSGVEVGIFNREQAAKSYGHNTGFEGHPFLDGVAPERRFIPDDSENFKREIQSGINRIIEDRLGDISNQNAQEDDINRPLDIDFTPPQGGVSIQSRTLFDIDDDELESTVSRILRRLSGQGN